MITSAIKKKERITEYLFLKCRVLCEKPLFYFCVTFHILKICSYCKYFGLRIPISAPSNQLSFVMLTLITSSASQLFANIFPTRNLRQYKPQTLSVISTLHPSGKSPLFQPCWLIASWQHFIQAQIYILLFVLLGWKTKTTHKGKMHSNA